MSHPGSGVAQIELDPDQRGGLFTLGAWLVSHGKKGRDNVVRRGMAVYRDAMCNDIAPLNIDLEAALKELVGADATIKEIAEARGSDATCGACHATSDPVGLAFESFAGDGTLADDLRRRQAGRGGGGHRTGRHLRERAAALGRARRRRPRSSSAWCSASVTSSWARTSARRSRFARRAWPTTPSTTAAVRSRSCWWPSCATRAFIERRK